MSTYLKFIVIAALLVTTGAIARADQSDKTASITDQKVTTRAEDLKESKVAESTTKTEDSSTEPVTTETSSQPTVNSETVQTEDTSPSEVEAAASPIEESYAPTEASATETEEAQHFESETVNTRPTPPANEASPEAPVATPVETQNTAQSAPVSIQANQMRINGQFISYSNAGQGNGQAIIDANPNLVATWGGSATQSGNDGLNTHFIGHNPGIFNVLFSVGHGDQIEVSDSGNQVTNYTVSHVVTVDDYGMAADGTDYWDQITGSGGGERITLQTCINDDYNLIVFANQ